MATGTYNTETWATSTDSVCRQMGMKFYLPMTISGSTVAEKYCPHFPDLAALKKYVREIGTFTQTLDKTL